MGRLLAVSSGGGHWEELLLLKDVFDQHDVHYATTHPGLLHRAGIREFSVLPDCNRNSLFSSVHCFFSALRIVARLRPSFIISTGAAPGFFCILAGRLFGAKTLWIESFANADQLSMCGRLSVQVADTCMVQWTHLARPNGPVFEGAML